MRASRLSPVRQNRTKRKMSAYSSSLERFVERTPPINYWPVYIHFAPTIGTAAPSRGISAEILGQIQAQQLVGWYLLETEFGLAGGG